MHKIHLSADAFLTIDSSLLPRSTEISSQIHRMISSHRANLPKYHSSAATSSTSESSCQVPLADADDTSVRGTAFVPAAAANISESELPLVIGSFEPVVSNPAALANVTTYYPNDPAVGSSVHRRFILKSDSADDTIDHTVLGTKLLGWPQSQSSEPWRCTCVDIS